MQRSMKLAAIAVLLMTGLSGALAEDAIKTDAMAAPMTDCPAMAADAMAAPMASDAMAAPMATDAMAAPMASDAMAAPMAGDAMKPDCPPCPATDAMAGGAMVPNAMADNAMATDAMKLDCPATAGAM